MSAADIIKPTSESQVADAVREAAARGGALEIAGHGTKRGFGRPAGTTTVLDITALSGIVKYEPEELVLTALAGTPLAEVEQVLSQRGQMLGFAPADWGPLFGAAAGNATLGGIAGANVCGARRVKAGAVRDHLIGCRFVNGVGDAIKAGGPVIKNVTGFDVPKLMCGAFGTLGVLTELTFRMTPASSRVAALAILAEPKEGLRILREALRSPLDPTGLAYIPGVFPSAQGAVELAASNGAALVRVEGADAPLKGKLKALRAQFTSLDVIELDDEATKKLFRDIDNGALLAEADSALWRLCVPPAEAHAALEMAKPDHWYADWAGGLLWLAMPATAGIAMRLRGLTARFGGHATLVRASVEARAKLQVFEPEADARAALTRAVKEAFDPKHVFNPGRMYEGI